MDNMQIEQEKLELDKQRLQLETQKLLLEGTFAKKYATSIISIAVAVVGGFFAIAQIWMASISKEKELEINRQINERTTEANQNENERQWKLQITDFIFKNREVIFSENVKEQQRLRDIIIVTFPSEITKKLFERMEVTVPESQKPVWQEGQQLLSAVDSIAVYQKNGKALFCQSKYNEAVAIYDKALSFDSTNIQVLNYKGYSLFRNKKYEEAVNVLTKAIKIKPDYAMANLNLAKVYCAQGNQPAAIEVMNKGIKLNPNLLKLAKTDTELTKYCKEILQNINTK
jgi:tetratricopeptide (TPR) repeat protein